MPFVAPAQVLPQGVKHPAFVPPPLDGSCTLVEAYDWHRKHSPDHVLYRFGATGRVLWRDAVRAVYRAAQLVSSVLLSDSETAAAGPPCFAVLAVADAMSVATLVGGLMRAGHTPFLPSPRVSPAVLRAMIDAAGVTHVFCSRDVATARLARDAVADRAITLLHLPTFEELFGGDWDAEAAPAPPSPPRVKPDIYDAAVIIHSSGSTSTPKLLPLSFSTFANIGIAPWNHEIDIGSAVMNFSALPMYHIMGLLHLAFAAYCGTTIAVFPPTVPPIVARPETLLESMTVTQSTAIYIMPSILETISLVPDDVEKLSKLDLVMYGGASLNAAAGDRLVAGGVKLTICYGMSEMGVVSAMFYAPLGKDWQWIRLANFAKCQFRDLGDGTHELIVVSHDGYHVDTPNCEIDGHRAIATKDVVVRHPDNPVLFKTVGRLDDQLVLSTGEKTNAVPLEAILQSDPRIEYAVMFGRSRPHNGVLIMPHADHAFDTNDLKRLQAFRAAIWPSVEKMNRFAPSHSRLVKQMVLVASPSKPFAINPTKRTVVRPLVMSAYEREINDAYEAFERAVDTDVALPSSWQLEDTLLFVRKVVRNVLPEVETDDDDLISLGCDSMKAALIHNHISDALRATGTSATGMPADVIYRFPTVWSLACFVSTTGLGQAATTNSTDLKVLELEHMLAKYSQTFPRHDLSVDSSSATNGPQSRLTFLVTGTTGGLGTNLLSQLLVAPYVRRVFALNRRGPLTTSSHERHQSAFRDRGLDQSLLGLDTLVMLEGDTTRNDLGLPHETYEELRRSVTHIIHNAWPVNFNYSIQTFEPAVRGARNLIDFALKSKLPSPPRFIFISSISVSRNVAADKKRLVPEEPILDAKTVAGLGYAESKWLVERMLQIASEQTPLQSLSVRVGQLAGGDSGCWNINDWVPVIVRSARALGCLPDCQSDIAWIRLHEAAASLLEMREARGVLHLVHPRPIAWRSTFGVFSQALDLPLVPFEDWMSRLSDHGHGDAFELPALRLLGFWKSLGKGGFDSMSAMEHIHTAKAQEVSPTLARMSPLNETDAEKWLTYWRRAGVAS